ncbi:hypothetical protein GCM10010340_36560 [Streptomyces griseoloalbus]|nr:hypothetical protein GCM10010340_36560 [Streptomyces albaduncus]
MPPAEQGRGRWDAGAIAEGVETLRAAALARDRAGALLPPDAFHRPVGRPVTHRIYRDAAHRSGSCRRSRGAGRRGRSSRTAGPKGECPCPVAR